MRYHHLFPAPLLFVLLQIVACGQSPDIFEDQAKALGTFVDITIAGAPEADAKQAIRAVEESLGQLDHVGYTFADTGELHALNAALSRGESMHLSTGLKELVEIGRDNYLASGGLINPAAGELTALWEFHCDREDCMETPYPEEVRKLVEEKILEVTAQQPSMQDLELGDEQVSTRNPAVRLEFGDIIRGYALDRARTQLQDAGIANAMIDIGGNIRSLGNRGDHPWWAPVLDATGEHSLGYIELEDDEAVFTVRAFDKSIGKQDFVYRHVIDPRTGLPVEDLRSVTVIHDSATRANVAATALLIAGLEDWASVAEKMGVRAVMIITREGTLYTSTAMEERIHWNRRIEHQHLVP